MSKIHVEIEIENGSSIRFDADLNKVLGRRAEPHEIIGGLERIILPGITRALGLRTEEDEAAINAEAVERANAMLETMLAAQAEEAAAGAPGDADTEKGDPYTAAGLGIDGSTIASDLEKMGNLSTEYLETLRNLSDLPEEDRDAVGAELSRRAAADEYTTLRRSIAEDEAADAELDRRRVAKIEAEILEDAVAKAQAERPDLDMEIIPSAEGEVRVKAKAPAPANRATRRRK